MDSGSSAIAAPLSVDPWLELCAEAEALAEVDLALDVALFARVALGAAELAIPAALDVSEPIAAEAEAATEVTAADA